MEMQVASRNATTTSTESKVEQPAAPVRLDRTRQYGIVYGNPDCRFAQDGYFFDHNGDLVRPERPAAKLKESDPIVSDSVMSAINFLRNILREGPLPKRVVYNEAEKNNQPWDFVTQAKQDLGIKSFSAKGLEMWKLQE